MSQLLIYAIKSAILLTLLFVPGIFLIFREKMFRFNRLTLLAILVLSLVLPLCNFSYISMDNLSDNVLLVARLTNPFKNIAYPYHTPTQACQLQLIYPKR